MMQNPVLDCRRPDQAGLGITNRVQSPRRRTVFAAPKSR
jgi:hypothetical protein